MSEAVQIAVIVASGPTLIGLLTVLLQYLQGKKLEVVHKSTNSLVEARVKASEDAARAEGKAEGAQAEKAEQAIREQKKTP